MIFFRKKKRKKEELDISKILDNDISFVEEETKEEEVLDIDPKIMINESLSYLKKIEERNNRLLKEYYICKIFSRVGLKDLDFNLQVISLDRHIDKLKTEYLEYQKILNANKEEINIVDDEIIKVYKGVKDLYGYQTGILGHLQEINNTTFGHLKITTVAVCMNKNKNDLEELYNHVMEELKTFKSFQEAAEYIYYNSGDFITNYVESLVNYISKSEQNDYITQYDLKYFIKSDVVITLEIKEWIDLYSKIKFVMKQLGNYDKKQYEKLIKNYNVLEARYAILMMHVENKG